MASRRLRVVPLENRDAPSATAAGAEFRANVTTSNTQGLPQVAKAATGNYVVVWESLQDGSGFGVYGRVFNAAGGAVTSEFRINQVTTGGQRSPVVAVDSDGDFVVAWESYGQDGAGSYGIYGRRYNAAGTAQGGEFLVNSTTTSLQIRPAVAIDADGDFAVVWQSYQDGGTIGLDGIYLQRFNAAGVAQGVETRVNTFTTQMQINPAVAMDDSGDFVVAWQSYTQDGGGYGVYAQRYNSAGAAQGGEFRVNQTTINDQAEPSVALDATGDFVVAWQSYSQDGDGWGVYARRYNDAGVAQGGEFKVNTTTASHQQGPAVASHPGGLFSVAWQSLGQEPSGGYGIYSQQYTAAGAADGGETHVNTFTTGNQTLPAVALDANGDSVVVWQSAGQDGSSTGVYGQRFHVTSAPRVQQVTVNDGQIQRSRVTSITVYFDTVVTLPGNPANAFSFSGSVSGFSWSGSTALSTPTQTVVRLTFSGANTQAGSLLDGNYVMTVQAALVSANGQQLDGNGDGNGGDNYPFAFFRIFGDATGEGTVDLTDFITLRGAMGSDTASPNYLSYFDANGDGFVDLSDLTEFRDRFGESI